MQESITSREFAEWMAFYQLEPFGEERDDLRSGIVAATIANANRNPKKRRRPFRAQEFMPVVQQAQRRERAEQRWEDQLHIVEMWNAALGGQDLRQKEAGNGKKDS